MASLPRTAIIVTENWQKNTAVTMPASVSSIRKAPAMPTNTVPLRNARARTAMKATMMIPQYAAMRGRSSIVFRIMPTFLPSVIWSTMQNCVADNALLIMKKAAPASKVTATASMEAASAPGSLPSSIPKAVIRSTSTICSAMPSAITFTNSSVSLAGYFMKKPIASFSVSTTVSNAPAMDFFP